MIRRQVAYFAIVNALVFYSLQADEIKEGCADCGKGTASKRITLRHIDPNGVGYHQGYTTLEGFFSPICPWNQSWVPFLDLRGHVFNNGKLAANAGIGMRYLASRVWGINTYYDYRNTNRQHYNQYSLGLETLGTLWDIRINGYLPVGAKASSFYHTKFDSFEENHMILSRKKQFAMKGGNAEMGFHVDKIEDIPLYVAGGPYYFNGQGKTTWGGEVRASVDFFDYFKIEANTSYDHIFKWIGQGQVSLNFPLGRKKTIRVKQGSSCSDAIAMHSRSLQPVDRSEIIVVDTKKRRTTAIDPVTNQPYQFWFVDNTSHSAGTYESPFPTLLQAQNASSRYDVIYVFEGDGTSTGMNQGITLKNNQYLFGSGNKQKLPTTLGTISIPPFTKGMPLLSFPGDSIVNLAHNNTVSGIHFDSGVTGILGMGGANPTLINNVFTPDVVQTSILLINTEGRITIQSNDISTSSLNDLAIGAAIENANTNADIYITDNLFNNQGKFGIYVASQGTSNLTADISGNTLSAPVGYEAKQNGPIPPGPFPVGILILGSQISTTNASIVGNILKNHEVSGISLLSTHDATINSSIRLNTVQPGTRVPITDIFPSAGIFAFALDSSRQNTTIASNTVTASKTAGISVVNRGTAPMNASITKNTVSGGGTAPGATNFGGGILTAVEYSGNLNAQIKSNTLTNNKQEGGILGLNGNFSKIADQGSLNLQLLNNAVDNETTLYNPSIGGTPHPAILLSNGYQSNTGTINFVPSSSPSIPPVPNGSIPPTKKFGPGGAITIIPSP